MLVAGLVAGATITFALTYPHPSSVGDFTSVSTTIETVTSISVSTITTTSVADPVDPTEALADAYLSHIDAIESGNATALAAQYETNATLLYASPYGGPPHTGSFDGIANITGFYKGGSIYFYATPPYAVTNETYATAMSNDDKAGNVASHLIFYGNANHSCCWPSFSATTYYYVMGFDISYVLQGDRWLISTETLTICNFSYCAGVNLSPDGNVFSCLNSAS
jgi:hypothetical protein